MWPCKYKESQEERDQHRQALFQNNRAFLQAKQQHQLCKEFAIPEPKGTATEDSLFIDPNYAHIIATFAQCRYKMGNLRSLIDKLGGSNVISHYKTLTGIYSLGTELLTLQNQLEILGTGVVSHLGKIMGEFEHPYLQIKSIEIILRLFNKTDRASIPLFFNNQVLPVAVLQAVIGAELDCLSELGVKLALRLTCNNYRLEMGNSNSVSFLEVLGQLIERWREDSRKLYQVYQLLAKFALRFQTTRLSFNQILFSLFIRLIQLEKQRQVPSSPLITSIVSWLSWDRRKTRQMAGALINSASSRYAGHENLFRLVEMICDFPLNSGWVSLANWKFTICCLASMREGLLLLESLGMPRKVVQWLQYFDQPKDKLTMIQVAEALLSNYLTHKKDQQVLIQLQKISRLLEDKTIFQEMKTLYQTTNTKPFSKILNSMVITMVSTFSLYPCHQAFTEYQLIKELIRTSTNFDCLYMKTNLKRLKQTLECLERTMEEEEYLKVVELLVYTDNFILILERLRGNYLNGAQEIRLYFQNLKSTFDARIQQRLENGADVILQNNQDQQGVHQGRVVQEGASQEDGHNWPTRPSVSAHRYEPELEFDVNRLFDC